MLFRSSPGFPPTFPSRDTVVCAYTNKKRAGVVDARLLEVRTSRLVKRYQNKYAPAFGVGGSNTRSVDTFLSTVMPCLLRNGWSCPGAKWVPSITGKRPSRSNRATRSSTNRAGHQHRHHETL